MGTLFPPTPSYCISLYTIHALSPLLITRFLVGGWVGVCAPPPPSYSFAPTPYLIPTHTHIYIYIYMYPSLLPFGQKTDLVPLT